jgi:hypothetical protein
MTRSPKRFALTLEATPRDATHWSLRSMARAVGFARLMLYRIWKAFSPRPHRTKALGAEEWFVIHHTNCGMEAFLGRDCGRSAQRQSRDGAFDGKVWSKRATREATRRTDGASASIRSRPPTYPSTDDSDRSGQSRKSLTGRGYYSRSSSEGRRLFHFATNVRKVIAGRQPECCAPRLCGLDRR